MKNLDINVLLDVYGSLLTELQRGTLELYYGDDLSLSEISDEQGNSRQAVMNCIRKSERKLFEFEEKLGLIQKFRELSEDIDELEKLILSAGESEKTETAIMDVIAEIRSKL